FQTASNAFLRAEARKRRRTAVPRRQSADKTHNRKNCTDKMKISGNFCFLRQLHLPPAVTYVHVSSLGCKYSFLGVDLPSPSGSSNPVARLQAQGLASRLWRPFLTIKNRQKRLGDKFCRWQNFLACRLSQRSDSLPTLSTS